jgi:hypothetical protein
MRPIAIALIALISIAGAPRPIFGGWFAGDPPKIPEIIPTVLDSVVPVIVPLVTDSVLTRVAEQVHWSMQPAKDPGEYYLGGFYKHAPGSEDFNPEVTFGEADNPYSAHLYFVAGPVLSGPDTLVCIGATASDSTAVVTNPDTVLVVFADGDPEDTYKETDEKWLGSVVIKNADGTPRMFNYGFAQYFDNDGVNFTLKGLKASWIANSDDGGMTVRLYYHGPDASWDYQAGGPAINQSREDMQTDYGSLSDLSAKEPGSWEKRGINARIDASGYGGVLASAVTGTSDALSSMNFTIRITQVP